MPTATGTPASASRCASPASWPSASRTGRRSAPPPAPGARPAAPPRPPRHRPGLPRLGGLEEHEPPAPLKRRHPSGRKHQPLRLRRLQRRVVAERPVQVEMGDLVPARPMPSAPPAGARAAPPRYPAAPGPPSPAGPRFATRPAAAGKRPVPHIPRAVRPRGHHQNVHRGPAARRLGPQRLPVDPAGHRQPHRQRRGQARIPQRLPVQPVQPRRPADLHPAPVEARYPATTGTHEWPHPRTPGKTTPPHTRRSAAPPPAPDPYPGTGTANAARNTTPGAPRPPHPPGQPPSRHTRPSPETHPHPERPIRALRPLGQPDHRPGSTPGRHYRPVPESRTTTTRSPSSPACLSKLHAQLIRPGRPQPQPPAGPPAHTPAVLAMLTASGITTSVKASGRKSPRPDISTDAAPTARACASVSHAVARSAGLTPTAGSTATTSRPIPSPPSRGTAASRPAVRPV